jgi:hypothetical protein
MGIIKSKIIMEDKFMWLRYGYHLLSAIVISAILLITTIVMDVLFQKTHLTQLLLNIDFLIDPKKVPTIVEGLIHLSIGIVIYIVFLIIYHYSKPLYYLAFVPLTIIFIVMYPFLIAIAQRSLFKFSWNAYALWMEAHILFMILMAISIPTIAKKHL